LWIPAGGIRGNNKTQNSINKTQNYSDTVGITIVIPKTLSFMQDKFIHKIRRLGKYSYGISFPKEMIKSFGWKEKQKLDLIFDDKKKQILIKDWKNKL
jgi:hypothetical protein